MTRFLPGVILLLCASAGPLRVSAQIDLSIFDGTGVEDPGEAPESPEAGTEEPGGEPETGEAEGVPEEGLPDSGRPPADADEENGEPLMTDGPLVPEGEEASGEAEPEDADGNGDNGETESGAEGEEEDIGDAPGDGEDDELEDPGMTDPGGGQAGADGDAPREPGRATEIFQPTERIRVDQSVDFPWDI